MLAGSLGYSITFGWSNGVTSYSIADDGGSDSYTDFGSSRPEPTTLELADATESTLAGKPVETPRTQAIGCPSDDLHIDRSWWKVGEERLRNSSSRESK
ncbi:MAG: hypothetical protein IT427_06695 [Pirellulales bacterium]|nr:hypothetical protein [Pirellulales bacterium]